MNMPEVKVCMQVQDILALHITHNLILGTQKCLTGLQREPSHSVQHVKLTTQ